MGLKEPKNRNYCATVVEVKNLIPLEGCDNLLGLPVFGMQAIVSKSTSIGDVGIVFPTETQLSEGFCRENNLFRHSERNKDPEAKGYLEDSRRVRSIKLRGHRSDALFLPISCLSYTLPPAHTWWDHLTMGDEFDELNGQPICRKYEVPRFLKGGQRSSSKGMRSRVERKFFPVHFDTENWFRNRDRFRNYDRVTITQKLHGTSVRIGHVPVIKKPTGLSALIRTVRRWFRLRNEPQYEYQHIYGSRRVDKIPGDLSPQYYETDVWGCHSEQLEGSIHKDTVVYGEIIGYESSGNPIQKNYTYDCAPGTSKLFIYRVTTITSEGEERDLSWEGVKEWCKTFGFNHVPELEELYVYDADNFIEAWLDKNLSNSFDNAVPLSDDSPCDEGVVLRFEGIRPKVYKAKSPVFLAHETKQLDNGVENVEDSQ